MPDEPGHGYQPKGGTVVDTASLQPPVGGSAVQEPGESLHDYAKRMSQTLEPAEPQPDEDEEPLITEMRLLRMAVERAADALERNDEMPIQITDTEAVRVTQFGAWLFGCPRGTGDYAREHGTLPGECTLLVTSNVRYESAEQLRDAFNTEVEPDEMFPELWVLVQDREAKPILVHYAGVQ